jgi:3'(2'), 5'-bisphosphate nucleotidase
VSPFEALEPALSLAVALCDRIGGDLACVFEKPDGSIVTLADFGVQALLGRALQNTFPGDALAMEEDPTEMLRLCPAPSLARLSEFLAADLDRVVAWMASRVPPNAVRYWVIDPIDGTRAFVVGGTFVVGIGLLEGSRVAGARLVRLTGHGQHRIDYIAWEGRAWAHDGSGVRAVQTSGREPPDARAVARDLCGRTSLALRKGDDRPCPSLLEAYIRVATGESDVLVSDPLDYTSRMPWDHVAGVALVEAAGGRVTDFDGRTLDFSRPTTPMVDNGLVVSNGTFHDALVASLDRTPKENRPCAAP